ncbi:hypothetical protein PFISCL1PPCAC_23226, partial [Pristionchus fissidentatus]
PQNFQRMITRVALLVCLLIGWAEGRVKLRYSEFLDGSDLLTTSSTEFACPNGCMVYSATEKPNLVIVNKGTNMEVTNLNTLATYNNANDKSFIYGTTLPPAVAYILKNNVGLTGDVFGLYVVYKDAPNYGQSIRVASPGSAYPMFTTTAEMMTIMTRGNGIRLLTINSDKEMTPKVFATGYDSTQDDCWPLFNATSLSHAQQTQVDVYSPILTIRFIGLPAGASANVKVGGDVMVDPPEQRNCLTISSPGFHGCTQATSLYQYNLNKIDRKFASTLEGGVNIRIRSKLSIAVESDALVITGLQQQPVKLMGQESYLHDFPVNKVNLQLNWQRTMPGSNFAVQMDATKSSAITNFFAALALTMVFVR